MKNFVKFIAGLIMAAVILCAIIGTFGIVAVIALFILALCNIVTWQVFGIVTAIYVVALAIALTSYILLITKGVNDLDDDF